MTTILVAIISSASVWIAWRTSGELASHLLTPVLGLLLSAALISYALRVLRFHYFVTQSGIRLGLRGTAVIQVIGFALSVTPGHIGEVFKLHLIREQTGTPLVRTAPLLFLDRLTEGGGFLILAIASGLLLPALRAQIPSPVLLLLGLVAACLFGVTFGRAEYRVRIANSRLAQWTLWRRFLPHFENLWRGLKTSFTLTQISGGLALSMVARLADGVVVFFAAQMMGVHLGLAEAVFVLAVSGLAGGISFLPAGTGAVETTMVGLLVLLGAPWSQALATALLARLCTLWIWVGLGIGLAFLSRRPRIESGPRDDQVI